MVFKDSRVERKMQVVRGKRKKIVNLHPRKLLWKFELFHDNLTPFRADEQLFAHRWAASPPLAKQNCLPAFFEP